MQLELIALVSAFFYAAGNVIIRRSLGKSGSPFNAIAVIFSGTIFLWLFVLFAGYGLPSLAASVFFALRGVMDPGIAAFLAFIAFRRVGASLAIPIIAAASLASTALSVAFLHEALTLSIAFGTILILAGVWLLAFKHDSIKSNKKYVLVAIAASAIIGAGAVVTKAGLNISDAPVGGLAISFSAALLVQALVITLARGWRDVPFGWKNARVFLMVGVIIAVAFLTTYLAFSKGAVNIVAPLLSTQPLFALVLSAILLRGYEKITRNVVIGTIVIVAGAALLTLA